MANWLTADDPKNYRELIVQARRTASRMRWFGIASQLLALLFMLVTAIEIAMGDIDLIDGLLLLLGAGFAAVVAGVATFASGVNLSLGAARLEVTVADQLESEQGPEMPGHL